MSTTVSNNRSLSASELRAALADRLRNDTVRTAPVDNALRSVARHLFLPDVALETAYADDPVYTKHDDATRAAISAASQPRIVALMLEQLAVEPGHRVLELGAGTGYNAALLAQLVGENGHVTTIDVDTDLVDGARQHLATAGVTNTEVILGDGALGHSEAGPYDRIIATVGAFEIPQAWLDQLAPTGRLVVPLRLAGAASRSIAIERDTNGYTARDSDMCTFMPLRGRIADDICSSIDLTTTGEVTLQPHADNTPATTPETLTGVLDSPRHDTWTGVWFSPGESVEWLYLWLTLSLTNPIMRMEVQASAKDRGLVEPMFPTVAMATTTAEGSLAYLTLRPTTPTPEGERRFEIGVIGHGPGGSELAEHVADQIITWNQHFRTRNVRITIPDTPPAAAPQEGTFVLERGHHAITVTWE
ncbi:protein-L-isoaspartate(D-aspartate) O-methyltransferase [Haloactinospora alba]|uniref:Protein-L-isoaspartate O-methyltransferase n=1 Tax=Haloactinospora alba TaxID=405555 RepID=A0A543NLI5_9ACTN|nr:methyltransferase, FxLD system [Haloactinospora alba]TQN32680.1 protein-L-isoaspartate(D-aspartate) O-methyltransferase [Haloactinospora alba]